jgi:hypothetical protein
MGILKMTHRGILNPSTTDRIQEFIIWYLEEIVSCNTQSVLWHCSGHLPVYEDLVDAPSYQSRGALANLLPTSEMW